MAYLGWCDKKGTDRMMAASAAITFLGFNAADICFGQGMPNGIENGIMNSFGCLAGFASGALAHYVSSPILKLCGVGTTKGSQMVRTFQLAACIFGAVAFYNGKITIQDHRLNVGDQDPYSLSEPKTLTP